MLATRALLFDLAYNYLTDKGNGTVKTYRGNGCVIARQDVNS